MGVHGLWKLIEPSGRPVPLEALENKVLAVDVSIWLHQAVKGFQDSRGASVPNAHLLGIYHRICKLLYFRIKPVFVFDGGVPVLKKQTIGKRNQQKCRNLSEADRIKKNLLSTLLKHSAVSKVLSERTKAELTAASSTSPTKKSKTHDEEDSDLYALPPSQLDTTTSSQTDEESSDSSTEDSNSPTKHWDLHSIDTNSAAFKSLPVEVRHDILTDLKETRKQSSWGKIHEMPAECDDFSGYQMRRLLKRQSVQTALEEAEKEMGGHSLSIGELEKLLKDQGVITTSTNPIGNRIASDENTRFLLIKGIKQAIEDAKKAADNDKLITIGEAEEDSSEEKILEDQKEKEDGPSKEIKNKADLEFENDLKRAISLSLQDEPSTSRGNEDVARAESRTHEMKSKLELSFLRDLKDEDFNSESSEEETVEFVNKFTSAKSYMLEYSGLTPSEIEKILLSKKQNKKSDDKKVETSSVEEVKDDKENKKQESPGSSTDFVEVENQIDSKPKTIAEESLVTSSESKNDLEPDSNLSEEQRADDVVDLVSESDSDDCVFVDVEDTPSEAVEVIIKPDEEPEDDLFKDIFAYKNEVKTDEIKESENLDGEMKEDLEERPKNKETAKKIKEPEDVVTESQNINLEMEEKNEDERLEKVDADDSVKRSQGLKENIERIIKQYSKPNNETGEENQKLSIKQMTEIKENLQKEQTVLAEQRSTKERLAGNITDQIYQETQELLHLFGVPYVIAPMEAEAQCAFLDSINLTDGTITDDSDIWLFGGTTVYKNFFNQSKLVMEYKIDNIQQNFKLTREQMILLAMLVGSDYTVGLQGVGPVTALEILAAFPCKQIPSQLLTGLREFRSWFDKGKLPGRGRTSLRSKLKNLKFLENFPNQQIVEAYLEPQVESSRDAFSWAKPDITGLIDFAKRKFGWTNKKSEEILNPVVRRLEEKKCQTSIKDYFKCEYKIDSGEAEKQMSKRVRTALSRIGRDPSESEDLDEKAVKKKTVKKKVDKSSEEVVKSKRKKVAKKVDEDIEFLKKTEEFSENRVKEIADEIQAKLNTEKVVNKNLHKKEVIPQKLRDKSDILKNKLKAIETFRKSKQGPGYVKKRGKVTRAMQEDAGYLSESSDD